MLPLLQECTLKQIMDHETEIIKNTQTLHSDMQTLVYENYNKFISATDTIRKVNPSTLSIKFNTFNILITCSMFIYYLDEN